MLELTQKEYESLRSQNATLKQGGHAKYLPYAFTEHGVLMLANVLKSAGAVEMCIKVIDVSVKLREMLLAHKDILFKLELLENQVVQNSEELHTIFNALKQLLNPPQEPRKRIGLNRMIFKPQVLYLRGRFFGLSFLQPLSPASTN